MEAMELILLALILLSAGSILFTRRIRTAVGLYMCFSLLLAILWGLRYGGRLAVTELGVGVAVTGLLFYFTARKLRGRKGTEHEQET